MSKIRSDNYVIDHCLWNRKWYLLQFFDILLFRDLFTKKKQINHRTNLFYFHDDLHSKFLFMYVEVCSQTLENNLQFSKSSNDSRVQPRRYLIHRSTMLVCLGDFSPEVTTKFSWMQWIEIQFFLSVKR